MYAESGMYLCRSEAAKEGLLDASASGQFWEVQRCTVDEIGKPSCCDGQLQVSFSDTCSVAA